MFDVLLFLLLILLVIAAVSVFIFDDMLYVVIIFGLYSMVMSLIWQQLNAPDIAITEAAVGVGTTILMVTVVTRIGRKHE